MRELSLNVMDIVQNSVRAGASLITVQVAESKKHDTLIITITDNGCGMSAEQVKSVIEPVFHHTHHPQGWAWRAAFQNGSGNDGRLVSD